MSFANAVWPVLEVLPGWPVPPAHSPLDILWYTVAWPFGIGAVITAIGLGLKYSRRGDEGAVAVREG
jgi:hypothetical protein